MQTRLAFASHRSEEHPPPFGWASSNPEASVQPEGRGRRNSLPLLELGRPACPTLTSGLPALSLLPLPLDSLVLGLDHTTGCLGLQPADCRSLGFSAPSAAVGDLGFSAPSPWGPAPTVSLPLCTSAHTLPLLLL